MRPKQLHFFFQGELVVDGEKPLETKTQDGSRDGLERRRMSFGHGEDDGKNPKAANK